MRTLKKLASAALIFVPLAAYAGPPPIVTPAGISPSLINATPGVEARGILGKLKRLANAALTNNPRYNPVMASPPVFRAVPTWHISTAYTSTSEVGGISTTVTNFYTETVSSCTSASSGNGPTGTGTAITDGTCSWNYVNEGVVSNNGSRPPTSGGNYYGWTTGTTGTPDPRRAVFRFLSGVPGTKTAGAAFYETTLAATVGGVLGPGITQRVKFTTDAPKFIIRTDDTIGNGAQDRLIVSNQNNQTYQYTSFTPIAPSSTSTGVFSYIFVDFTGTSTPRLMRDFVFEYGATTFFGGIDVLPGNTVFPTHHQLDQLKVAVTGDSFCAGGGITNLADDYIIQVLDEFGVWNVDDDCIGGTGLLNPGSGQTTAIQRITDINCTTNYSPDLIVDLNGHNDAGFGGAVLATYQAAELALLQNLRANCPNAVIIVLGVNSGSTGPGGTFTTIEQGRLNAVTAMNDPLIFTIPEQLDPNGFWITDTAVDTGSLGTGNGFYYSNGNSTPHPNAAGHVYMAKITRERILDILNNY